MHLVKIKIIIIINDIIIIWSNMNMQKLINYSIYQIEVVIKEKNKLNTL